MCDDVVIACPYEPPHEHRFPADWQFGGANGLDPRADPRWETTVYEYFDGQLHCIHTTVVPLCDDEAIDRFTNVAGYGPTFDPVYLSKRRPYEKGEMLPWKYDKASDLVVPL
jgi:hypothetical protein